MYTQYNFRYRTTKNDIFKGRLRQSAVMCSERILKILPKRKNSKTTSIFGCDRQRRVRQIAKYASEVFCGLLINRGIHCFIVQVFVSGKVFGKWDFLLVLS